VSKVLIYNRGASHHYQILERFEAGLVLHGSEVKSLRTNRGSLAEAYIVHRDGELFLTKCHIPEYAASSMQNHAPTRERKVLMTRRQIRRIVGQITRKGMTAIPLKIYVNNRGLMKMELSLAVGLKKHDKRQALKEKEWDRQQHRILKQGYQE
jgi:SsrA-binding protein